MEIKFTRVHTVKDLTISAVILAAGIGLYFVNQGLGILIAVCGALLLLLFKAGYKRIGSDGPVLTKKAFDVAHSCRQSIKEYLDGKETSPELKAAGGEGVVRLEVYFNKEAGIAYAQLFDFTSYSYEKATEIVEIRGPRAEKLLSQL